MDNGFVNFLKQSFPGVKHHSAASGFLNLFRGLAAVMAGDAIAKDTRLSWADYAKGIGILLVVYGHVLIGVRSAELGVPEGFFRISNDLVYGFHMPLFFLLSGLFVEKAVSRGIFRGLSSKLFSLIVPYFFWSLLQGSVGVLLSGYKNSALAWGDLSRIWYSPMAQFWFLYVLFLIFVLYFALRVFLNTGFILALSAIGYFLAPYAGFWVFQQTAAHFIYFAAGSMMMGMIQKRAKQQASAKTVWVTIGAFLLANGLYLFTPLKAYALIKLPVALAGIGFTLALSSLLARKGRFKLLTVMGRASMSIYLMHILVGSGARIVLSKLFGIYDATVHVTLGTLLGVLLPLAADRMLGYPALGPILLGKPLKKKWKDASIPA